MNSAVLMVDVYSNPGNVIMKTIVKMDLMKRTVTTHLVLMVNLLAPTIVVSQCLKSVME